MRIDVMSENITRMHYNSSCDKTCILQTPPYSPVLRSEDVEGLLDLPDWFVDDDNDVISIRKPSVEKPLLLLLQFRTL